MHESDGEIVIDTLQVHPVPERVLHLQVELEPVGLREWPTHQVISITSQCTPLVH